MLEWVAGRNITPRQRKPSQARGVLKLQVYTDDEAETDTLAVTYPRSGSYNNAAPRKSTPKQVKFSDASQQALVRHKSTQQPVEQPVESDLEVETSGSEESTEVIQVIKRKKRAKNVSPPPSPPKEPICLKGLPVPSEATDDDEDITPHPSCPCAKCVYGRKLLKKAEKKRKALPETEGETKPSESFAPAPPPPANTDNKGDATTNATGETVPIVTDEPQKNSNGANAKDSSPGKAIVDKAQSITVSSSPHKSNSKKARVPKAYASPEIRNPNLIVPARAEVLQIEHAVETPEDPRPNAFVDNEHGICRVYHGPAYGNPYGSLYPRRGLSGPPPFQPLPAGVPHPTQNPYYNGFDPNQMARHGQPPPPNFPPWTGYVPPPPPAAGYSPGPPPEMAYPTHMPWYNYQVPAEGRKGHKKVSPPVVLSAAVPPVLPSAPSPPFPPVEEPLKPTAADVTEPQKPNDRPPPPFGLLTPRAIAAKFSDKPASSSAGKGKDKDKGWTSNVAPISPSHKSGSHHSGSKGDGGDGWGGGSARASNNNNPWGSGPPAGNSPRMSNKDINDANKGGNGNGWGGSNHGGSPNNHRHSSRHNTPPKNDGWGGGNNDGANDGWGGGSQRSGSKKSSNHSRNSANQTAANIGGDGWGGGWDTASVQKQGSGNGNWGGNSPRHSNNGGHNAFNTSPRVSNRGNNDNNDGWGDGGNNHRSGRHSNSPHSGGRHRSGSGNHNFTHDGKGHHHRSSSRMPGSWESLPSNNAGPQGTPGSRSRGGSGSNRSRGRSQAGWGGGVDGGNVAPGGGSAFGGSPPVSNAAPQGGAGAFAGFEGTWNTGSAAGGGGGGGAGGGPAWGDPTAAQSTAPMGGW